MISPDTQLYIYEIRGHSDEIAVHDPPSSFIGIWNEEEFTYLFFTESEDDYVKRNVCGESADCAFSRHDMQYRDWQTGLPARGMSVEGIEFVPADHTSAPEGSILLDPSVVFGDGSHPTTCSCLKFLSRTIQTHTVRSVLDLGTGTGILALAAAKLGVPHVTAVDRNILAVQTARENVVINGFQSSIEVHQAEARIFIDSPYDVVLANLPFHVLRDLVTLRGANLHKFWIVSGIDPDQANVLKELFVEQGYRIGEEAADAPWVTFTTISMLALE
jgi:ribosomal protein L11 methyltransferase